MFSRTNSAPKGSQLREEVRVQPFPESGLAKFGITLLTEDWGILEGGCGLFRYGGQV